LSDCIQEKKLDRKSDIKHPVGNPCADGGNVTLLGLLDMSAAFDFVDQVMRLQRLQLGFGLTDEAILTGRTQQVTNNGELRRRLSPKLVVYLKALYWDLSCTYCTPLNSNALWSAT
jgi:hypothetical protein